VRLLHSLARTRAAFDDPHLVSHAGLVPLMALAERAGLPDLVAEHVRPSGACGVNASPKVACLVAGMAAGADSIDDMDAAGAQAGWAVADGLETRQALLVLGYLLLLGETFAELAAGFEVGTTTAWRYAAAPASGCSLLSARWLSGRKRGR
jgi:hypothetical protein